MVVALIWLPCNQWNKRKSKVNKHNKGDRGGGDIEANKLAFDSDDQSSNPKLKISFSAKIFKMKRTKIITHLHWYFPFWIHFGSYYKQFHFHLSAFNVWPKNVFWFDDISVFQNNLKTLLKLTKLWPRFKASLGSLFDVKCSRQIRFLNYVPKGWDSVENGTSSNSVTRWISLVKYSPNSKNIQDFISNIIYWNYLMK